ncbi:MAG: hypothetical protein ACI85Z_001477 [Rheinheimera aquimaris]|jgi:hypothetical protein
MSSDDRQSLPGPEPKVLACMLRRPAENDVDATIGHSMAFYRMIDKEAF